MFVKGAPMMDCKKALSAEAVKGDIKLALDWLRAKGSDDDDDDR